MSLNQLLLVVFSFSFGVLDASLGMGYGTILTPLLIIIGFDPLQVIPAILLSQLIGDFSAAFFHHRFENANLSIRSRHFKTAMAFGILSVFGSVIAVMVAISLPTVILNLYIGTSVVASGLILVVAKEKACNFSRFRLLSTGLLAAFNKGISAGGYGPILIAGQASSGIKVKTAIGITSLAEAVTCAFAMLTYILVGKNIDWSLSLLLSLGIALSSPLAAFIVKEAESKKIKALIGISTFTLGLSTILQIMWF